MGVLVWVSRRWVYAVIVGVVVVDAVGFRTPSRCIAKQSPRNRVCCSYAVVEGAGRFLPPSSPDAYSRFHRSTCKHTFEKSDVAPAPRCLALGMHVMIIDSSRAEVALFRSA
jgi:hypothetical protein